MHTRAEADPAEVLLALDRLREVLDRVPSPRQGLRDELVRAAGTARPAAAGD